MLLSIKSFKAEWLQYLLPQGLGLFMYFYNSQKKQHIFPLMTSVFVTKKEKFAMA